MERTLLDGASIFHEKGTGLRAIEFQFQYPCLNLLKVVLARICLMSLLCFLWTGSYLRLGLDLVFIHRKMLRMSVQNGVMRNILDIQYTCTHKRTSHIMFLKLLCGCGMVPLPRYPFDQRSLFNADFIRTDFGSTMSP